MLEKLLILVSHCVVCKDKYDGGHVCITCKNPCHAICGEAIEEGYGKPVVCFQCKNKNDGTCTTLPLSMLIFRSVVVC